MYKNKRMHANSETSDNDYMLNKLLSLNMIANA